MHSGSLNQRVTIQRRVVGEDAAGQPSTSWVDVVTVYASVLPLRGRDFLAAAQNQASFDAKVTLRFGADVLAGDRLLWGAQVLDIVGHPINVGGRRVALELMCMHGVRVGT